jgi:AcrR family transcriptional regulator
MAQPRLRSPEQLARRDARRQALVGAAVRVIRAHGPHVSMDQVAAEVGVTRPILYRYFGDRDGLADAVAEQFSDSLLRELRAALGRQGEPRQVLNAAVDAFLGFVERDPEVYRFVLLGRHRPGRDIGAFVRQVAQEVVGVLDGQLRRADRDPGAAEPWAYGMVGMVRLAGDWWVEHRSMPRERLVEHLTTLLWDGLGSLRPTAADPGPSGAATGPRHAMNGVT